jgi:hypothetical protein
LRINADPRVDEHRENTCRHGQRDVAYWMHREDERQPPEEARGDVVRVRGAARSLG